MSNKFLGASSAGNLADGTVLIYASSLGASGLNASYPVKTNSLRQLVSSKLNISDINNLQDTLDNVLTNPFTGTLHVTDLETANHFSLNDELNKIDNITSATQGPAVTNISGLVSVQEISTDRIYNTAQTIWVDMDANTVDISATNLKLNGNNVITTPYSGQLEATSFKKTGGTGVEYLMANGSSLTQSANSGNSNFYLYNNSVLQTMPISGSITYNNTNPLLATYVYLSNITRDAIDILVFFKQINQLNDLYIQDQESSLNFIKYNITENPIISATYIAIPVIKTTSGGDTSFGSKPVMVSFFTNNLEIDTRLSTLETNTQKTISSATNTALNYDTITMNGDVNVNGVSSQAVLGAQDADIGYNYQQPSNMGYEFIPTNDIVVTALMLSTLHWRVAYSMSTTKKIGIYRESDATLICSETLTKTIIQSGYYGKTLSTPVTLYSGIKYVLSTEYLNYLDRYSTIATPTGSAISNIKSRTSIASSAFINQVWVYTFAMPTELSIGYFLGYGNFIYYTPNGGSTTASKYIVKNQTSSVFLKGDGSTDSSTYLTATALTSLNDKTYYQSKPTAFNTTFNSDIYPLQDNLFNLGFSTNKWRYLFCSVAVEVPTIDQVIYGDSLKIGPALAGAIEIGRSSIQTNILGTTMINNAYTLPTVAPQVGQLLQCNSLGSSSWTTSNYVPLSGGTMTGALVTTGIKTPSIDTNTVVPLNIGTTNATTITLGRAGQQVYCPSSFLGGGTIGISGGNNVQYLRSSGVVYNRNTSISPFGAPLEQIGITSFAGSAYSVQSFYMPENLSISSLTLNRSTVTSLTISVAIYNSSLAQIFTSTLTATTATTLTFPASFDMSGSTYYYFAVYAPNTSGFYSGSKAGGTIVNSGLNASLQYSSCNFTGITLPTTLPTTGINIGAIIQPPFTIVGY